MRRLVLLPLLAAASCTAPQPAPTLPASLAPTGAVTEPTLQVGQNVAAFFRRPQAGQPAAAARAIADLEWMATSLPTSPQFQTLGGAGLVQLGQARNQARSALGIAPNATPQAMINGLASAATALDAGDQAAASRALPRSVFTLGPEATIAKLAEPPSVPSVMPALQALASGRTAGGGR